MPILQKLVGKTIAKVFYSPDYLIFEDSEGIQHPYTVEGDCCSQSLFYDFFGIDVLIGGTIKEIKSVPVTPSDIYGNGSSYKDQASYDDSIQVYGYQITVQPKEGGYNYGERTAVFSFRNYSNGYYGGSLVDMCTRSKYNDGPRELTQSELTELKKVPQLTHDTHCVCILTGEHKN